MTHLNQMQETERRNIVKHNCPAIVLKNKILCPKLHSFHMQEIVAIKWEEQKH